MTTPTIHLPFKDTRESADALKAGMKSVLGAEWTITRIDCDKKKYQHVRDKYQVRWAVMAQCNLITVEEQMNNNTTEDI